MALDRERILKSALRLVEREGLDALSMRKLGKELDVEAMSLYNHVKNKNDLLDGLHEIVLAEIPLFSSGDTWQEQAKSIARNARLVLQAHPNTIPLFTSRPAVSHGSLRYLDHGLSVFLNAGFSKVDSIKAFQCIYAFVVGHVQFYAALQSSTFGRVDYNKLPTTMFSNLVDCAEELLNRDVDVEFESGLESMISGFQSTIVINRKIKKGSN